MTNLPPVTLVFTNAAARKVYQLILEEGKPDLNLRVFITGGGCSGFKYGFTFDEKINDDDIKVEKKLAQEDDEEDGGAEGGGVQVRLLIDPMSYLYLAGAEIDYKEDVEGSRFVIRNPNAQTTCGCGSSFSA